MKLKQFIEQKNVTGFEMASNIIVNVVCTTELYQLDTDTSQLEGGCKLYLVEDYTIDGDILTVNGISVNMNEIGVNYEPNDLEN
jgi:hypothetical protein